MTLENIVEKSGKGFIAETAETLYLSAIAAATTSVSTAFVGPLGIYIGLGFGGGGYIGNIMKGKPIYDSTKEFIKTYASVNAVISSMDWLGKVTYPVVGKIGKSLYGAAGSVLAKTAYAVTLYNSAFIAKFRAAYHLIEKYFSPKGVLKSIKKDFKQFATRINTGMAPSLALTANGLPGELFAANAVPVSYYDSKKEIKNYSE